MSGDAARRSENAARFRAANERQRSKAAALVGDDDLVPFLCECPDERCTGIVLLTLPEFDGIRATSTDGFALPGHEDAANEQVVELTERFAWTRKTGAAAEAFSPEASG